MEYIQALFLGIVQGITEFLPVSSSGHLYLIPNILGWEYGGLTFDIALHVGTIIAVISYFWKDLLAIAMGFCKGIVQPKRFRTDRDSALGLYIALAILPAGIIGLLFDDLIELYLRTPVVVITMLISIGILFLLLEKLVKPHREFAHIRLRDALIIGCVQTLALVPGVSRSGSTMAAALFLGIKHEAAARFSFLLGTPITAAAAIYKLKDLFSTPMEVSMWIYFGIGTIAAGVSGYLAIGYLLTFLKKHSFAVFGWYRIALGCTAIALLLLLHQ